MGPPTTPQNRPTETWPAHGRPPGWQLPAHRHPITIGRRGLTGRLVALVGPTRIRRPGAYVAACPDGRDRHEPLVLLLLVTFHRPLWCGCSDDGSFFWRRLLGYRLKHHGRDGEMCRGTGFWIMGMGVNCTYHELAVGYVAASNYFEQSRILGWDDNRVGLFFVGREKKIRCIIHMLLNSVFHLYNGSMIGLKNLI